MEIIEGKQNGSQLYVYNNYTYCRDNRYDHIYRCSKRRTEKCSAVLRKEGELIFLDVLHNHPEEPYFIEIDNMKREMIKLSKETTKPFKVIFDTVCRTNLLASAYISYNNIKSMLSRERAKSRPKIPNDLYSLHQQLEIYEPIQSIYKGCAISIDNKIALIFSNDVLLNVLSEASEIFVDGTFSIVPKKPNITQLYSIHVRYADVGIAVVFVLCEVRSASLYKAMWEKIVSLVPDLSKNLKFIMMDYEKAAITIMNRQFPAASIHGCWFHYSQALYRKWRRLQLNSAPAELLSMAISMALAPSSLFLDSLNLMQNVADRVSATYPNVLLFMAYLRNTWLPIASKVSVHNCPVRTNNLVESFHHIVNQKVGTVHPNLWVFLEHLSEIITNQEIDYSRLRNNIRVRRPRTRSNKQRNIQIKEGQSALINGDISLEHFLHMFSRFNQHYQQSELLPEANDHEEIDGSLLSNRIPDSVETRHTQNFNRRRQHRSRNSLSRQEEISPSIESSDIEIEQSTLLNINENFVAEESNMYNECITTTESVTILTDDEEIYRIPEDDYSFLDESLTSPEITYHKIDDIQKIIDDNNESRPEETSI